MASARGAAIESLRPFRGNEAQGFREFGLDQPVALGERLAAGAEDRGGFGIQLRATLIVGDVIGEETVDAEPLFDQVDRRPRVAASVIVPQRLSAVSMPRSVPGTPTARPLVEASANDMGAPSGAN